MVGFASSCFWSAQASATDVCAKYTNVEQRVQCLEDVGNWDCRGSESQKSMSACFVKLLKDFEEKYNVRLKAIKPGCGGRQQDEFFDGRTRLAQCAIYNVEAGDPGPQCVRVSASSLRCCDVTKLEDKTGKHTLPKTTGSWESYQKAFCKNVSCELGSGKCLRSYTNDPPLVKVNFKGQF
jgi:hypothetical protein